MYTERDAPGAGGVLWTSTAAVAGPRRIIPDGCLDLIWTRGELIVAGPDTAAAVIETRPGDTAVGLRFSPGNGPLVLGVPAHELRDLRVPLGRIWDGALVRRLTEQVGEARSPGAFLSGLARERFSGSDPDPMVAEVLAGLAAGESVAACAVRAGYSERQLHRRCREAFGYGLKTLSRVLRMHRAVELARRGTPFSEISCRLGYADQAHLSREVKALAGVELGRFRPAR
ncbi:helix-turn-helix domain-containing protein [Streptomyces sp. NPDC004244]|uniref:helix-turn-helix transcriptional regulator n=1 Tax=Streptomyces sp. NPDC101206 TaxID=3366128 RepID=UPI0038191B8B